MGGAVSNIAGRNWAVIGDAAACVNPLNGEGIDYGLEGGRLVVEQLGADDLTELWPTVLREHYGQAFSVARRLAGLLTVPQFLPASGSDRDALTGTDDGRRSGDGEPRHRRRRPI